MALNLEVIEQVNDNVRISVWSQNERQTVYTVQERNQITGGYGTGHFKWSLDDARQFAATLDKQSS